MRTAVTGASPQTTLAIMIGRVVEHADLHVRTFKNPDLIQFARVAAGSTVVDVYPGEGDWTRVFSDAVGPKGRVYSFAPAEVAHFKSDPVGKMQTLAKEANRENVEVVSSDLSALPGTMQAADVLWLHLFITTSTRRWPRPRVRPRPRSTAPSSIA